MKCPDAAVELSEVDLSRPKFRLLKLWVFGSYPSRF